MCWLAQRPTTVGTETAPAWQRNDTVSLARSACSALAIAAGVFLLTSIESLLTVVNVPNAVRQILEGAILLIVLALYSARDRPSQRGRRAARRYTVPAESQGQTTK